jgi:type IV secretion system protein TrbL
MPGICDLPGVDLACEGVGSIAADAAGNAIETAAHAFAEALGKLTSVLLTFWTDINTPGNLDAPEGPVAFLRDSTSWIAGFILIISLMIAGGKMAITHRAESGIDAARGVWQFVLYAGAGVPAILLLGVAGDQYSQWILDKASGGDLGGRIGAIYSVAQLNPLGPGLVLIMALFGILSSLAQMALMIIRVGMLVALAGLLPVSAAAAVSKGGKATLARNGGWLLAWALYKPAAATVYAVAFATTGKGQDPVTVLSGLFLIMLSILTLPALMRLLVPAVASITGQGGGGGAGAGIAAGGAIATGALQMRSMKTGNGGSGGGSAPSPRSTAPTGSDGTAGRSRGGTAAAQGASGDAGRAGGAAAGGGQAGGAAAAARAGGPVGAGVAAGAGAVQGGVQAVRGLGDRATGGGPTGSESRES